MPRWLGLLISVLPLAALVAAGFALRAFLQEHTFADIAASVKAVPWSAFATAIGATIVSFMILPCYDWLGARYAGAMPPVRRILYASPISYAFSNAVGISVLTSSALRLRLYRDVLEPAQIAKLTAICTLMLWLGPIAILPFALAWLGFSIVPVALAATLCGAGLAAYVLGRFWWRRPVSIAGVPVSAPKPGLAIAQILVSIADWSVAAIVLAALVPSDVASPTNVIAAFLVAQLLGLLSHLPGGIGVFEASIVGLLGMQASAAELAGPLVLYRAIYYILPLITAGIVLVVGEAWERRIWIARVGRVVGPGLRLFTPGIVGASVFVVGFVLLASAVTPGIAQRFYFLEDFLPIGVIQVSYIASATAGVALLFLARGLVRRHQDAYVVTLMVLAVGAAASLLKGADYEEAVIAIIVLILLWTARPFFYRRAAVFDLALTPLWTASIALALGLSVWLGLYAFRDNADPSLVGASDIFSDWRHFRRALEFVAALLFAILVIYFLTRGPRRIRPKMSLDDLSAVQPLAIASPATYAQLAFLADKQIMLDEGGKGFLMYGIAGRSWIAMGDPVAADPAVRRALLWRYLELCDEHDAWPVFYQAWPESIGLYLDAGLAVNKMGEEALVDLQSFTLDGSKMSNLRQSVRAAERRGLVFSVVSTEETARCLPEMKQVSDAWLTSKNVREKGFSLGRFDEAYLGRFPTALVRLKDDGRLVAFANIWASSGKVELSVDLMRAAPDAPSGHMDFLFANLMRWGKAEGYQRFNLGMAPMSGLETHALAPLWHRAGNYIFSRLEALYNFQGLRQYKQKFGPRWESRYLVSPGGASLPQILVEASALVSGGLMGVLRK